MAETHGIKLKDTSGNEVILTPEMTNVVSSGQATMPNALVDTDKYYTSIDLPGTGNIPINNVGCIANPFLLRLGLFSASVEVDIGYYFVTFADGANNNYTKNLSTGVMTAWTPGSHTNTQTSSQWDHISSIFPVCYWDKLGASTVTAVKIFTTMRYQVYDRSADDDINPHQIGDEGVEKVDYIIVMQRKDVE